MINSGCLSIAENFSQRQNKPHSVQSHCKFDLIKTINKVISRTLSMPQEQEKNSCDDSLMATCSSSQNNVLRKETNQPTSSKPLIDGTFTIRRINEQYSLSSIEEKNEQEEFGKRFYEHKIKSHKENLPPELFNSVPTKRLKVERPQRTRLESIFKENNYVCVKREPNQCIQINSRFPIKKISNKLSLKNYKQGSCSTSKSAHLEQGLEKHKEKVEEKSRKDELSIEQQLNNLFSVPEFDENYKIGFKNTAGNLFPKKQPIFNSKFQEEHFEKTSQTENVMVFKKVESELGSKFNIEPNLDPFENDLNSTKNQIIPEADLPLIERPVEKDAKAMLYIQSISEPCLSAGLECMQAEIKGDEVFVACHEQSSDLRVPSISNETSANIGNIKANVNIQAQLAVIPYYELNSKRRSGSMINRKQLKEIWNPEWIDSNDVNKYFADIEKIFCQKVQNEEKILKFILQNKNHINLLFDDMKKNKAYYRGFFSVSSRSLRSQQGL